MNRRFEMHQYRHILARMRLGESDRQIDQAGLMGRRTAAKLRKKALASGWLDPDQALPSEAELHAALSPPRRAQALACSSLAPYESRISGWLEDGIQVKKIHQTLKLRFGYDGSYSSLRRFAQRLRQGQPRLTTVLTFEPAEAARSTSARALRSSMSTPARCSRPGTSS